jgi:hypothetical protein
MKNLGFIPSKPDANGSRRIMYNHAIFKNASPIEVGETVLVQMEGENIPFTVEASEAHGDKGAVYLTGKIDISAWVEVYRAALDGAPLTDEIEESFRENVEGIFTEDEIIAIVSALR